MKKTFSELGAGGKAVDRHLLPTAQQQQASSPGYRNLFILFLFYFAKTFASIFGVTRDCTSVLTQKSVLQLKFILKVKIQLICSVLQILSGIITPLM